MAAPLYLIFGPQGSGKSTQGRRLADKLKLPHFDAGQELRRLASESTELGQRITTSMNSGQLVNNETLYEVIDYFLTTNNTDHGLVIDGFPRTIDNCQLLEKLIIQHHWETTAIIIEISDATVHERLTKRAEIEKRPDDQPAIIAKRLANYRAQTMPAIEWIKNRHTVLEIDGEPDVDQVTAELYAALGLDNK